MRRASLFPFLCLCAWMVGCGSGGTEETNVCPACVRAPEAAPADDGNPTGVYKGVLFGGSASGTVKITIASDQSTGTCQLSTGGRTYASSEFTADVSATSDPMYTFSDSDFTLVLVLAADGQVDSATLTLSGSDVGVAIAKEQSTVLVECFEGTWTEHSGDHGIWNLAIVGPVFVGGATTPTGTWGLVTGTVSGLQLTVDNEPGRTGTGTLSDDRMTMTGTFTWPDAYGTTEGRRTL